MFLSSSGVRGGKFISVYNVTAQYCASFENQRILNFRVMAVRGMKLRSRLSRNIHLSHDTHLSRDTHIYSEGSGAALTHTVQA